MPQQEDDPYLEDDDDVPIGWTFFWVGLIAALKVIFWWLVSARRERRE